ncbi:hypothetical protein [Jeotgalibacillus campisalis]|uniref:Uncharacterized protein n=1 Tax=Jeotgalibacillus campisalis TaxID=220754 RepID=A0A0C2RMU7_9BACL|nr:hypothetical protein [Jeotgalibacillus campisalis]KIL43084.1 hypothetical protein KR50_34870 [Jeotgalibacillus campisalis]
MKRRLKNVYPHFALLILMMVLAGCSNGPASTIVIEEDSAADSVEVVEIIEREEDDSLDSASSGSESEAENLSEDPGEGTSSESEETAGDSIEDSATEEDQQKAVSLTQDYLRDRDALIEDENNFVQYDGTINQYVIVRYSSSVSGHSSTNGRYAVDLALGEVIDVTNAADFERVLN